MVTVSVTNSMKKIITVISLTVLLITPGYSQNGDPKREAQYFEIKKVKIPEQIILEVGGLTLDPKGRLYVCTRHGEIWIIENSTTDKPIFKRFASGLHEPLGLAYKDGAIYSAQRGELSKIVDTNHDDVADSYETIYSWPLAANYHEYSYGPLFLPNGDMLVALNLGWTGKGESLSKWRGWFITISPDGKMGPLATGLRSPAGFNLNADGDLFYAENQGDWVGSGRMTHIEKGVFAGNPQGLKWTGEEGSPLKLKFSDITDTLGYTLYEYSKIIPAIRPPSVWFPHTIMGISTSDILLVPNNTFGPYKNQFLVGDQGHSKIMRVFQEKVKGVYQGICFPFREGFSSGIIRLKWAPDNSIFVGMTSRGWASTGPDPYGLERVVSTGKVPFEMAAVRAMPDGFEIEFTKPIDAAAAKNIDRYQISDFTYLYHHIYGSPVVELEKRPVFDAEVSSDHRKVRLYVSGLREGMINEIKIGDIKSNVGEMLLHNVGYYTLNNIPDGPRREAGMDHTGHSNLTTTDLKSSKRVTSMPSSWTGGPEQSIVIKPVPGLQYDTKEITVKAGSKVRLTFDNTDDMLHNFVIVKPGTADKVAQEAINLGLEGQGKGFIPDSDEVLYYTNLLQPRTSDTIFFEAPQTPGTYTYVCTYPGHSFTMRGVMNVIK
jgi:azurin/glucose/arabinose dehydrogenase